MNYHFVGIGGVGLSAIARVLIERGHAVSGSDEAASPFLAALESMGARIAIGHSADNVRGAQAVIISSAVRADNPEVQAAIRLGLPVYKRSEFLGELTQGFQTVAVAGTHGKTTTTGLIAFILARAGLGPSFVVGGALPDFEGANAHAGRGSYFVIEADEYDRAFLGLSPLIAVVTNVEHDHPDCYASLADVQEAFRAFLARLAPRGCVIACADASGAMDVVRDLGGRVLTYGLEAVDADWSAAHWEVNPQGGNDFLVLRRERKRGEPRALGRVSSRLPGLHNIRNALAGLCAAEMCGVDFETAREALRDFHGASRRFEIRGEAGGITVVDDYAHHPSEIRATLSAARQRYPGRSVWAVWQPHTYSRARALQNDFARAFEEADHVLVTPVYRSREREDPSFSSESLVEAMAHADARFVPSLQEASAYLLKHLVAGDIVITLSAGDGNRVGETLLADLARPSPAADPGAGPREGKGG